MRLNAIASHATWGENLVGGFKKWVGVTALALGVQGTG